MSKPVRPKTYDRPGYRAQSKEYHANKGKGRIDDQDALDVADAVAELLNVPISAWSDEERETMGREVMKIAALRMIEDGEER